MTRRDGKDSTGVAWATGDGRRVSGVTVGATAARGSQCDREERGDAPAAPRVNCFTPGTSIATPRGDVAIEALKPGDTVVTRDNGPQVIGWVGCKQVMGPPLRVDNRLHPVVIRADALGAGLPERDLRLSPNHRVLLLGDHPSLDVTEAEVFVLARHLVGTRGVEQAPVEAVRYLHFMCDRHEVVMSNGAWTESFQPSDTALQGVSEHAREELIELFPDLVHKAPDGFGDARPTLPRGAVHRARA